MNLFIVLLLKILLILAIGMNGLLNMKTFAKKRKKNVSVKAELMLLKELTMISFGLYGTYYFIIVNQLILLIKILIFYQLLTK
jgi:hypothetical protein